MQAKVVANYFTTLALSPAAKQEVLNFLSTLGDQELSIEQLTHLETLLTKLQTQNAHTLAQINTAEQVIEQNQNEMIDFRLQQLEQALKNDQQWEDELSKLEANFNALISELEPNPPPSTPLAPVAT
jgi:uncharacterized membrane protein YheB (UPF0754 family)